MKVLIITQTVDRTDPVLGFMHRWLEAFGSQFAQLSVICLRQGEHQLPENIKVFSLGKEHGQSRIKYIKNLFRYLWRLRHDYDAVLVHMNQEYVVVAGWWWRLSGKRVYMWRNHPTGNWLTRVAGRLCNRVFCTSPQSFTASFPNVTLMPAGIDTEYFKPDTTTNREGNLVLSIGRLAPAKDLETLIKALAIVRQVVPMVRGAIIGDPLPEHQVYAQGLKELVGELGMESAVTFVPGIANTQTVDWYRRASVFINMSRPGFFDKTIFEGMACECPVIVSNIALQGHIDDRCIFEYHNVEDLAHRISTILTLPTADRQQLGQNLRQFTVSRHSLQSLVHELASQMTH